MGAMSGTLFYVLAIVEVTIVPLNGAKTIQRVPFPPELREV
jgi:hypothetical protein